jgi:hypothetical protein
MSESAIRDQRAVPVSDSAPAAEGTGVAGALIWLRYLAGTVGIFLGWLFISDEGPDKAIFWVCLLAVGAVGVIAFLSHVVFARADARRLRWPVGGFQYEVGFANLAFAIVAILAVTLEWGAAAQAAIVIGFAIYLLQGGLLFLKRMLTEDHGIRFLRNVVLFFLFGGMMLYFGIRVF